MRNRSIKFRVALWYAFSILAILFLVTALIAFAGNRLVAGERTSNLVTVTDRTVKDVRIVEGKMVIDDDIVYYSDGAYVVVYRGDGRLISGLIPEGFPEKTAFEPDRVRKVRSGGSSYYVYDRLIENRKVGKIWIRGMTSARLKDLSPTVTRMLNGFLIALPLLFVIALSGGWIMTKQAFAPLNQIVSTAEDIRKSGNLKRRIGLGSPEDSDEIQRTAAVFDEMLDQIEKDFEKEKQFTNDAGHELRTPIAVILAESEYALDNPDREQEVTESLLEIRNQARRMSSLVTQILTLARADRNRDLMNKEIADISLLAEESAERFHEQAARRGILIHVEAEECSYMDCDPLLIGRMYDNLIDNSLKYGRAGGRTDISVSRYGKEITIDIRDDGIGIRGEDLERIWDRFYRGSHRSESTVPDGKQGADSLIPAVPGEDEFRSVGLGLSMVREIVHAHGGEIRVESEPGKGTCFHITFQAKDPE